MPRSSDELENKRSSESREVPEWLAHARPPAWGESQDTEIPDWLSDAAPPSVGLPPEGEVPDWLSQARPAAPAPPVRERPTAISPRPEGERVEPLDWLDEPAPPAAKAPEAEEEVPDWLAEPSEPAAEAPEAEEIPDWLGEPAAPAAEAPEAEEELPDWLAEPSEPAVEALEAEEELPDWLAEPSEPAVGAPEAEEIPDWLGAPAVPAAEVPEAEEELPDWLAEPSEPAVEALEAEEIPDWLGAPAVPAAEAPEAEEEVPDWLAEPSEPAAEAPEAEEIPDWLGAPAAPAAEAPEAEEELPDWLAEPSEPVAEALKAEEIPDWLGEPAEAEGVEAAPAPEAPPLPEPEAPPSPVEVEVPDWLSEIGEGVEAAPAPEVPPSAEVEAPLPSPAVTEVPDWLAGLGEAEGVEAAPVTEAPPSPVEVEVPDWLSEIGEGVEAAPAPEAPPLPEIEAPPPLPEPEGELTLDWLDGLDFGDSMEIPVDVAGMPPGGEDLLGLTEDLSIPAVPEAVVEEEAAEKEMGELPEWLRAEAGGISTELAADIPEEQLGDLQDLRFEAIAGAEPSAEGARTETVGALKDVAGVIKPEMIFEGDALEVGGLIDRAIVTKEQQRQIALLERVLEREMEGFAIPGVGRAVRPVLRWLLTLLMLAAIALPIFTPISPLSSAVVTPGVSAAYQTLESASADARVIVAFEYDPDTSAELQPLALALLGHLSSKGADVYALSTRATGPAMADTVFEQLGMHDDGEGETPDSGWLNLGYIPGGANGISGLVIGTPSGVPSPLAFDYKGHPTDIVGTRLADVQPSLIIVVTARAELLRDWIEQAGSPSGIPVLAAMSVSSAPVAQPYWQSGQVVAVLSGISDAVTYRALSGQEIDAVLFATWNGQALGGALAGIAIVVGGVLYGVRAGRTRAKQEQDR